jgi:hypothetical protein
MKWPATLTFIRHGESAYNVLKAKKEEDDLFQRFKRQFEKEFAVARDDTWVSEELSARAREVWRTVSLPYGDTTLL